VTRLLAGAAMCRRLAGAERGWRHIRDFVLDYPLPCALWVAAFVMWLPSR